MLLLRLWLCNVSQSINRQHFTAVVDFCDLHGTAVLGESQHDLPVMPNLVNSCSERAHQHAVVFILLGMYRPEENARERTGETDGELLSTCCHQCTAEDSPTSAKCAHTQTMFHGSPYSEVAVHLISCVCQTSPCSRH